MIHHLIIDIVISGTKHLLEYSVGDSLIRAQEEDADGIAYGLSLFGHACMKTTPIA